MREAQMLLDHETTNRKSNKARRGLPGSTKAPLHRHESRRERPEPITTRLIDDSSDRHALGAQGEHPTTAKVRDLMADPPQPADDDVDSFAEVEGVTEAGFLPSDSHFEAMRKHKLASAEYLLDEVAKETGTGRFPTPQEINEAMKGASPNAGVGARVNHFRANIHPAMKRGERQRQEKEQAEAERAAHSTELFAELSRLDDEYRTVYEQDREEIETACAGPAGRRVADAARSLGIGGLVNKFWPSRLSLSAPVVNAMPAEIKAITSSVAIRAAASRVHEEARYARLAVWGKQPSRRTAVVPDAAQLEKLDREWWDDQSDETIRKWAEAYAAQQNPDDPAKQFALWMNDPQRPPPPRRRGSDAPARRADGRRDRLRHELEGQERPPKLTEANAAKLLDVVPREVEDRISTIQELGMPAIGGGWASSSSGSRSNSRPGTSRSSSRCPDGPLRGPIASA